MHGSVKTSRCCSICPVVVVDTNTFSYIRFFLRAGHVVGNGVKFKDGVCVRGRLRFRHGWSGRNVRFDERKWTRALVHRVIDTQSFVSCARHHTRSGEESVVDRIGRDERVSIAESNINHDQVVNVIQMVSDLGSGKSSISTADDEVAGGTIRNLVGNVAGNMELAISPTNFELCAFVSFENTVSHLSRLTRFVYR